MALQSMYFEEFTLNLSGYRTYSRPQLLTGAEASAAVNQLSGNKKAPFGAFFKFYFVNFSSSGAHLLCMEVNRRFQRIFSKKDEAPEL